MYAIQGANPCLYQNSIKEGIMATCSFTRTIIITDDAAVDYLKDKLEGENMTELEQLEIVRECCRHMEIISDSRIRICSHPRNEKIDCTYENCPILNVDTKQFSIDVDEIKKCNNYK